MASDFLLAFRPRKNSALDWGQEDAIQYKGNATGNLQVSYTYDAWGKPLTATGPMAATVGTINPLRYRGYVYDAETGLYYLRSRFYNPKVGRFLNGDIYVTTGQGFLGNNTFVYCLNDPISYYDTQGTDAIWIYEPDSAFGAGHAGLLVQDSEGAWWFFYWGPYNENGNIFSMMGAGVKPRCVLVELEIKGEELYTKAGLKQAVAQASGSEEAEFAASRSKLIESAVYFEGDYSKTYEYLTGLEAATNAGKTKYNLLTFNCAQVSWTAMSRSNNNFKNHVTPTVPYFAQRIVTGIRWLEDFLSLFEL